MSIGFTFSKLKRQQMLPLIFLSFLLVAPAGLRAESDKEKPASSETDILFETAIRPIFQAKCGRCHNPKARKAELDLTSFAALQKGGESGKILSVGKPDESLLYEMVHEGSMPPEDKNPLTKKEIHLLKKWIESGAHSSSSSAITVQISQHDILPIMYFRCTVCHGLRKQEAGLDLRTKASMLKGGKSGPAIVLGNPKESLLLKKIHSKDMPPRKLLVRAGVRPVELPEIEMITQWIAAGAPEIEMKPDIPTTEFDTIVTDEDRQFWSFQSPKRPKVPTVKQQHKVRNAIDAFTLRKLEEQGLSLSPEADKLTLIRRVSFDLTGLPPTISEIDKFLADQSDSAYPKMINNYLASKHYGERWGRYWLDLSGYADSEGKRSADTIRPHAWRYRDYVIRAFNTDKHYDRFLLEQIAGDELADYENAPKVTPEIYDNLVATGFLRMAPDGTGSDIVNTAVERMEVIVDTIDILSASVMGLTMKCSQCHSHKYDPIPQRDYYRMVDIFKGAYDQYDWLKPTITPNQSKQTVPGRILRYLPAGEKNAWLKTKANIDKQIADLNSGLKKMEVELTTKLVSERLAKLPKELHSDLRKMLATSAKKRDAVQKYLAGKFGKQLTISTTDLAKLNSTFKKQKSEVDKKTKALKGKIPPEPAIRALWDRGEPSPTYISRRGVITNPGRLVGPGVPSVLTDGKTPFAAVPPWPGSKKTGRRLAFAKWLTQKNHPLTARVMVNRIWKQHFGRGIVKSLHDFGHTGTAPTHPDLLDWLATEFVASDWSIKAMHRTMMNSATYRQVSTVTTQHETLDPENDLVSRMPLTRMDAEALRDSILIVSGRMNADQFGQPDAVKVRPDGLVTSVGTDRGWRRSIYVQQRRKEILTILENFDLPQMIPNCLDRPESTVASQALHLMNNSMIHDLSRDFANRVQKQVGSDNYAQVERVYRIALARLPSDEERELGLKTLSSLTEQWKQDIATEKKKPAKNEAEMRALANYCHTILNSAAFIYID